MNQRPLAVLCLALAAVGLVLLALELLANDFPVLLLILTAIGVLLFGSTGVKRLRRGR